MRNFLVWLARSIFLPRDDPMKRIRWRLMETERYLRKSVQWDQAARSLDPAGLRHLARRCRAIAELYRLRARRVRGSYSSRVA